ncbi:uncharacterized protein LOC106465210 isoform X2 [Limulus polyphemus]|uniref:Direct IAP-binding protein with low pI n=1 Tax=Limulus polyphemus TaxID=6850 RepID=A0ABM1SZX6_LIMPO|nr:uncharacterized protein LOC106465210 isoform X2 [Limulus polyphemus]
MTYFLKKLKRMLRMFLRSFPGHAVPGKILKFGTVNMCLVALCTNISEEQKDEKDVSGSSLNPLSHEFLIKQACVCMVESATCVVTHVTQAILDGQEEYIQALEKLLTLMEYNIGAPVNPVIEDDIWQDIIAARSEVHEKNKKLIDLQSKMMSVENLINSAAETAFNAGAEYAGIVANEHLLSAKQQIKLSESKLRDLEAEVLRLKKQAVSETSSVYQTDSNNNVSE